VGADTKYSEKNFNITSQLNIDIYIDENQLTCFEYVKFKISSGNNRE